MCKNDSFSPRSGFMGCCKSCKYSESRAKTRFYIFKTFLIALKNSVGVSDLQDLRRNLEKSERQRHQLSNHIDVSQKTSKIKRY